MEKSLTPSQIADYLEPSIMSCELVENDELTGQTNWRAWLIGQIEQCEKNHSHPALTIPPVIWESIGNDDFIFRFGDYRLRVEQMDKARWWWCIYFKDGYAGFDEPKARTELEAKLLAELCFLRHLVSNQKNEK